MSKEDYMKFVDEKILPQFREQLLAAYDEGAAAHSLEQYARLHKINLDHIIDFGLSSNSKWIIRCSSLYCYTTAVASGLQLPTKAQIAELARCKFSYQHFDSWHGHILGPNGTEKGVFDCLHDALCLWASDEEPVDDYVNAYLWTYIEDEKIYKLQEKRVYVGDKFHTLFVLPTNLA